MHDNAKLGLYLSDCKLQQAMVNENREQELVLTFSCRCAQCCYEVWLATFDLPHFPTEVYVWSTKSMWQLASCLDVWWLTSLAVLKTDDMTYRIDESVKR